jgi:hypothetical protein
VLKLGTYHRPGPAVAVEVRDATTHRVLRQGRIAAGYPDIAQAPDHSVRVGSLAPGHRIEVCVLNRGDRRVAVYGNAGAASRTSSASRDGKPIDADMTLEFRRSPRSVASMLGDIAGRAGLFKGGWTGAWTFWVLGLLVLGAVPALLVQAARSAQE